VLRLATSLVTHAQTVLLTTIVTLAKILDVFGAKTECADLTEIHNNAPSSQKDNAINIAPFLQVATIAMLSQVATGAMISTLVLTLTNLLAILTLTAKKKDALLMEELSLVECS